MTTGPDMYRDSLVDRVLVRLRLLPPLPEVPRHRDGTLMMPTANHTPAGTPRPLDRQKIQQHP